MKWKPGLGANQKRKERGKPCVTTHGRWEGRGGLEDRGPRRPLTWVGVLKYDKANVHGVWIASPVFFPCWIQAYLQEEEMTKRMHNYPQQTSGIAASCLLWSHHLRQLFQNTETRGEEQREEIESGKVESSVMLLCEGLWILVYCLCHPRWDPQTLYPWTSATPAINWREKYLFCKTIDFVRFEEINMSLLRLGIYLINSNHCYY